MNDTAKKQAIFEPIDRNTLDTRLEEHAYKFAQATENLPVARQTMSLVKQEMEKMEAELYLHYRQECEEAGEKFTETKLSSMVKTTESYIEKQREFLEARRYFDELENIKAGLLQEEVAIKLLAQLFQSQYWSLETITKNEPLNEKLDSSALKEKPSAAARFRTT